MKLLVVGVQHRIQWIPQQPGPEWLRDLEEFAAHLREQALRAGVDLIGEESSEEALRRSNARESVARKVAASLHIRHQLCDPDSKTRSDLSITTDDQREAYWLARLQDSTASVTMFLCGEAHVDSLTAKAKVAGHEVDVLSRNWGEGWQLKA